MVRILSEGEAIFIANCGPQSSRIPAEIMVGSSGAAFIAAKTREVLAD